MLLRWLTIKKKKKKLIYHLSKHISLRGCPAVMWHEGFTELKAPTVSLVTLEDQEQPWLFGIATCKSARTKPMENMWNLRGMSSSLESDNHGAQPQHAILGCLPGRAVGRKGLTAHGYLLRKQQNSDTSFPPLCSCSLFLSHAMLAVSLPKRSWKVRRGPELRKALFSPRRYINRRFKR